MQKLLFCPMRSHDLQSVQRTHSWPQLYPLSVTDSAIAQANPSLQPRGCGNNWFLEEPPGSMREWPQAHVNWPGFHNMDIYICVCVCICGYVDMYVYIYMCVWICIYIYIFIYMCVWICVYIYIWHIRRHICKSLTKYNTYKRKQNFSADWSSVLQILSASHRRTFTNVWPMLF